jgi:hypothetical protein
MGRGKLTRYEGPYRLCLREILFLGFGGSAALGASRESFHRHGKERPDRNQRYGANAKPE